MNCSRCGHPRIEHMMDYVCDGENGTCECPSWMPPTDSNIIVKIYCRTCKLDVEITQATLNLRKFIKCPNCYKYLQIEESDRGRKSSWK